MAIRDRVTVRTDESTETLQVERQGGTIMQTWPKTKGNYEAEILDKNGQPIGESIVVPVDRIVSVVTDKAERKARK